MSVGLPACEFATLVDQYYDLLYRYAYRLSGSHHVAEDLTQQTFLSAQSSRDQLRDVSRAKAWLFTILRNCYLKSLRDPLGHGGISLDQTSEPADVESRSDDEIPVDSAELQTALMELPEEFRSALVLFYFEEFSYKEISDQLAVPIGTVMSRLSRGRSWLKRRLSACLVGET